MHPDFTLPTNELSSIGISLLCGALLGVEREYRNKSTGLRTIILISLGSTIFTLVSHHGSGSDDRIAANIITGIGFIGAGVIFKDKMGVLGLTTAAVIWVAAAIGMMSGFGAHKLCLLVTSIVLAVLLLFGKLEQWINTLPQNLQLTITLSSTLPSRLVDLEADIRKFNLGVKRQGLTKSEDGVNIAVLVRGRALDIAALQQHLLELEDVRGFY